MDNGNHSVLLKTPKLLKNPKETVENPNLWRKNVRFPEEL